jgi:hypothetical protein
MGMQRMSERGLTPQQAKRWERCNRAARSELQREELELLRELRAEGWSLSEIGGLLGVSKQRVEYMLNNG